MSRWRCAKCEQPLHRDDLLTDGEHHLVRLADDTLDTCGPVELRPIASKACPVELARALDIAAHMRVRCPDGIDRWRWDEMCDAILGATVRKCYEQDDG